MDMPISSTAGQHEPVHHFGCTGCGGCCRGWRLPLSVAEAIAWTNRGHDVEVLCQAIPWSSVPGGDDHAAHYQWETSFAAVSGPVPVRVNVILAANLDGACPHLHEDLGCGIYTQRPQACRIYPAGLDPFAMAHPKHRRCPTEAWSPENPVLLRSGACVDEAYARLQKGYQASARADAGKHGTLCALLGLRHAAITGEGSVIHRPDRATMLAALRQAETAPGEDAREWTIISSSKWTVEALLRLQAHGLHAHDGNGSYGHEWEYVNFFHGLT